MIFLTCAGVSLALISSLWCFLALRRYSRWGRRRGTQINNPVRRDLHKSQLAHLQCISMTLTDKYELLPVCGQMRVVSWSWIRHGPGTPGNNFCLTIPVGVLERRVGLYKPGIFWACLPWIEVAEIVGKGLQFISCQVRVIPEHLERVGKLKERNLNWKTW